MRRVFIWTFVLGLLVFSQVATSQPLVKCSHDAFVSYYDLDSRNPALVVWNLSLDDFKGNLKVKSRHFKADSQLPPPRVKDGHYKGSGYVRGHLCPAGDRDTNKRLLKETYLTSNLTPMTMVCNSGPWKLVEDTCRVLARKHGRMISAAGTIFLDDSLGVYRFCNIKVPAAFFRIVRCTSHPNHEWIWLVQNCAGVCRPVRISNKALLDILRTRESVTQLIRYHGLIE